MIDLLFLAAAVLYVLAGGWMLGFLLGTRTEPGRVGVAAMCLAAALHAAHDGLRWLQHGTSPFAGIAPALSALGLLVVVSYLAVRVARPNVEVVGAFLAPVVLVMFLGSRGAARNAPAAGPLFTVHIGSSLVGIAALTIGAAMAAAYLIQERQMKRRRLGGMFRRLPPLETLDTMTFRCISIGIPALTLGVVTGHVVAVRVPRLAASGLPWQQYFAMFSWLVFVAVVLLRLLAGWRGRRAAIGTIVGFASSLAVLLFYLVRGVRV